MRKSSLTLLLAVHLFFVSGHGLLADVAARPFAHESSDLKADPAVVWGSLPNGMRYAILPNGEPPKRVSMRLYVRAGSLMEEDTQQGLAHFLEHMAFNGTKNFKADEMKAYFERLGMSFGGDTNAHTSFAETVYDMELPEATDVYLKDAFKVFRDYADGMLLDVKELDKERGVILSEKLARDTVGYRTLVEGFKFSMPESQIPKRLPIGQESVIKSAPKERFTSFYQKWYTPDRLTLIVVGKVDAEDIKKRAAEAFGDMKSVQPIPNPDWGKVSSGYGIQVKLHSEKEAGNTTISFDKAWASPKKPDTQEKRFETLVQGLADAMVNRRMEKLVRTANPPFISAETGYEDFLNFVEGVSLRIECEPENWQRAMATAEQELRRAIEHGFTAAEFKEATANLLEGMENAAKQAPTRRSRDLASELQDAIANDRVVTHPADDFARVQASLEKVTPEMCHALLKKHWAGSDMKIFVGGNLVLEKGEAKIKEVYEASTKVKVDPPKAEAEIPFAYKDFGPAGKVAKQEEAKDIGVQLVTFENNVRLTLKPTDFQKNAVAVSVGFGSGRLGLPKDKPGLKMFADSTFDLGGLGKHSADDLQAILAGKSVSAGFTVGDAACSISGETTADDLLLQLQLLCAHFTDAGYREDGQRQLQAALSTIYTQVTTTAEGVLKTQGDAILRSDDYRFQFGTKAEMAKRTMADVKAWLAPQLKDSFVEIAIVGDFQADAAIEAVSKTFGTLPKRADKPAYEEERKVKIVNAMEKVVPFPSSIPKAIVAVHWPTQDRRADIKLSRHLNILASVLEDRINTKVREELGDSYSPHVASRMSDHFTGDGSVMAIMTTQQKEAAKIAKISKELAAKLAAEGCSDDDVNRAKQPILKMLQEQMRKNEWWLTTVLAEAHSSPNRLTWPSSMLADYESVTKADIDALAKKYLGAERAVVLRIEPQAQK